MKSPHEFPDVINPRPVRSTEATPLATLAPFSLHVAVPASTQYTAPPLASSFLSSRASMYLDALRGMASLLVVIGHWRNAFFVDFPQIEKSRPFMQAAYGISDLGHQAVIIFFALSGYLVGGSVINAIRRSEWSWARYLTQRLVRLWLVLLPALLLGLFWDRLGIHLHQAPLLYSGYSANHMTPDVAAASSIQTFLGNAFFLQTIYVPTFGSNGALWSLANEWWYYLLFPLAACVVSGYSKHIVVVAAWVVAFGLLSYMVGSIILALFPAWLLGAFLHLVSGRKQRAGAATLIISTILYCVILCGFGFLGHHPGLFAGRSFWAPLSDNLLGVITVIFLWILLSDRRAVQGSVWTRAARGSARFSYSLYVVHLPLVIFAASLLVHDSRWIPDVRHIVTGLAVLALIIAYAWSFAWLFEFRTDVVRAWIEIRLGIPARQANRFSQGHQGKT
jgi:peptidoglycan/LPS O-acetylase OafA/YrhL